MRTGYRFSVYAPRQLRYRLAMFCAMWLIICSHKPLLWRVASQMILAGEVLHFHDHALVKRIHADGGNPGCVPGAADRRLGRDLVCDLVISCLQAGLHVAAEAPFQDAIGQDADKEDAEKGDKNVGEGQACPEARWSFIPFHAEAIPHAVNGPDVAGIRGSVSIFLRRFFMCASTVLSYPR